MTIMLNINTIRTIQDIKRFVKAADKYIFEATVSREEKARWVRSMLIRLRYKALKRRNKGLVRKYLQKVAGYSDAQMSRHIKAYNEGKKICQPYRRHTFPQRYTKGDQELLAYTDNLHQRLNGVATKHICAAMYESGDKRYERLAGISPAHLYRLRQARRYKEQAVNHEKTKASTIPIGQRTKPQPNGKPGYIRVDSVHQGDLDKEKGVYHINLVDEVTQWEIMIAVPGISERYLLPALKEALDLFPFKIVNFHSDNGSEYINKTVARLLNKLLIKQTKSRPRRSNDNGLVESKNGAIVRKYMGHAHIPRSYASRINRFYQKHLIPYINYHRPCAFPKVLILKNGKKKTTYPHKDYATPYKKLISLSKPQQYLRPHVTLTSLRYRATQQNPNQAAETLQKELHKMQSIIFSSKHATIPPPPS